MTALTVKTLEVTAQEENGTESNQYKFLAYEFPNGLIQCNSDYSNDWYFCNREEIQPNGMAYIVEVKELDKTCEWELLDLAKSLAGSSNEFSYDDSIKKGWELIKSSR